MISSQALAVQEEIKAFCEKKKLWYKIEHDCKPELKMIRIEISVKVEEK